MFNSKNYVQDKSKDSQRSIDGNKAAAQLKETRGRNNENS